MTGWMFRLRRWIREKRHELAHRMGNHSGTLTNWFEPDGDNVQEKLMIGFKCDVCGKLSNVHESQITIALRERKRRYRDL